MRANCASLGRFNLAQFLSRGVTIVRLTPDGDQKLARDFYAKSSVATTAHTRLVAILESLSYERVISPGFISPTTPFFFACYLMVWR